MPTTPYEVVSEARLRFNLRLPDATTEDSLTTPLADILGEAVSFVTSVSGIPIYDQPGYVEVQPYERDCPLEFFLPYIQSIQSVAYWENADVREDPDQTILPADLGRIVLPGGRSGRTGRCLVYQPADGWPSGALKNPVHVNCTLGFSVVPAGLCAAIIAGARQLFDGAPEIKPTAAMYAWIAPHKRVAIRTAEFVAVVTESPVEPVEPTEPVTPTPIDPPMPVTPPPADVVYMGGVSTDLIFTASEAVSALNSMGTFAVPDGLVGFGYAGLYIPDNGVYPISVRLGNSQFNSRQGWSEVDIDLTIGAVHYDRLLRSAHLNLVLLSGENYHFGF